VLPSAPGIKPKLVIVGGGLGGLAAAVALADRGFEITLVESRPTLGGRAGSFHDPASGETLDNCQHVTMGCCTNLADFCRRTGIDRFLEPQRELFFADEHGRVSRLSADPLPTPLHLARSFLGLGFLTLGDKLRIARGMLALARSPSARPGESFAAWLRRHGQSERVIERYWALVLTSALNESIERIGFNYARQVFVEGFLAGAKAMTVEIPNVPLGDLYDRPLTAWLVARGVRVLTSKPAESILADHEGRVRGVRWRGGETLPADRVILAAPWHRQRELLPPDLAALFPSDPANLGVSAIIGIHAWFDRPVCPWPHLTLVGRMTQWLFRRQGGDTMMSPRSAGEPGRAGGVSPSFGAAPGFAPNDPDASGLTATTGPEASPNRPAANGTGEAVAEYLQGVISAANDLVDRPREELLARFLEDVRAVLPAARAARLVRSRVVVEKWATWSCHSGSERLRPSARTPVPGLYLAGDHTRSGWPATMEGAVRSGYLAAEALLADVGEPARFLVPGLRPTGPFGWFILPNEPE
jgi:squalene-associated FAD-dependent desaturase